MQEVYWAQRLTQWNSRKQFELFSTPREGADAARNERYDEAKSVRGRHLGHILDNEAIAQSGRTGNRVFGRHLQRAGEIEGPTTSRERLPSIYAGQAWILSKAENFVKVQSW